eukprot:g18350.t1
MVTAAGEKKPAACRADEDDGRAAVIVDTSWYFYNYRHAANALSFYLHDTVKQLGVPDSQFLLFLAEDYACSARNSFPRQIVNDQEAQRESAHNGEDDRIQGSTVLGEDDLIKRCCVLGEKLAVVLGENRDGLSRNGLLPTH